MRKFILLEVIIAASLMAIIVSALLYSFREIVVSEKRVETLKQEVFYREEFQLKMKEMVLKAKEIESIESSLSITFNNEVDPDPDFSRDVKAFIYLDRGRCKIKTTPVKAKKERENLFFQNIKNIHFYFWDRQTKKKSQSWKKKELPFMCRIELELLNKEIISFSFCFPSKEAIKYTNERS